MRKLLQSKVGLIGIAIAILTTIFLFLSLGVGPSIDKTTPNNTSLANRFELNLSKQNKNNQNQEQTIALDVDTIPTYDSYIFLGYAWSKTATTPDYAYDASTKTFTPSSITLKGNNPQRTLYAVWKDPTAISITTMQQMTNSICSSMPVNKIYTLTDSRNNVSYKITHTADGHCWMLDDLKYGASKIQDGHYYYYKSAANSACPSGWSIPSHSDQYFGTLQGSDTASKYGPFPIGYIQNTSILFSRTGNTWSSYGSGYWTTGEYWGNDYAGAPMAFRVNNTTGKATWSAVTGNGSFLIPVICRF